MKKYVLIFLALTPSFLTAYNDWQPDDCWVQCKEGYDCRDRESRSFMFPRSINDHLSINQSFRNNFMYDKHGPARAAAELTIAFQKSNPAARFGNYFLFNCSDELLVAGDSVTALKGMRNVRAEYLGLPSNFSGRFSLNPTQTQFGVFVAYNQDLSRFITFLEHAWLQIDAPVVYVENNVGIEQFDLVNATSNCPGDIISALDQPNWLYAKFSPHCSSQVTLAEINIKFGTTYLAEDNFLIAYYSLLSLPTGHAACPEHIFSAFAGNNGHVGAGGGVLFQVVLNENTEKYVSSIFLDLQSTFLIRHYHMRTFDLIGKPWSRYLLLTNKEGPVGNTEPGVNILTRQVRVRPYAIADFTGGFRFKKTNLEFEIGFDIWGHAREHIDFTCPFPENYGIAALPTFVPPTPLPPGVYTVTASKSTIQFLADPDKDAEGNFTFIPIVESMLDQRSATSFAALNYKFHMDICYMRRGCSVDWIWGAGVFFDFPYYNSALQLIGAWAKVGAAF